MKLLFKPLCKITESRVQASLYGSANGRFQGVMSVNIALHNIELTGKL